MTIIKQTVTLLLLLIVTSCDSKKDQPAIKLEKNDENKTSITKDTIASVNNKQYRISPDTYIENWLGFKKYSASKKILTLKTSKLFCDLNKELSILEPIDIYRITARKKEIIADQKEKYPTIHIEKWMFQDVKTSKAIYSLLLKRRQEMSSKRLPRLFVRKESAIYFFESESKFLGKDLIILHKEVRFYN